MDGDILAEYETLLRFPSIGADPLHLHDCTDCACWLKQWLKALGFDVRLHTEGGHPPFLLAERSGAEGSPTVLLYGHYDVQPPDPLEEWTSPPFEPTIRGDRLYARGAQDDKGQSFAFLCGMRAYLARAKDRAVTLKVLLEGEEESGSTALTALAPALRKELRADVLAVCDTSAAADLQPAIVAGLRGVSHFTLRLEGANRDLHSGEYGGVAPNAAQALCELLATLHDAGGAVAVAGFEDGLVPPSARERELAAAGFASEAALARDMGVPPCGGERKLPVSERNCFRGTIEVNGVHSGYGGPGSKTVIPSAALAKLSMRLAPGMAPNRCLETVRRHLETHLPPGMKLFLEDVTGCAAGFRLALDSPLFRLAAEVLKELDPRGAVFQWDGASIPVVATLREVSGAAPLLVGFGQPEDRIHAPNESFSKRQFRLGMDWADRFLSALSGLS